MQERTIPDMFQALDGAMEQAQNLAADQGAGYMRSGRRDKAHQSVEKTSKIAAFRKKLACLAKAWRQIESNRKPRPQHAAVTDGDTYATAVLQALNARGGHAHASRILDDVGELLDSTLLPTDYELLASGYPRWRSAARRAKDSLAKRRLVTTVPEQPGVWALTAAGHEVLEAA